MTAANKLAVQGGAPVTALLVGGEWSADEWPTR